MMFKWLRLFSRDAVRRDRFEGQMNEEIRFHLDSRIDDLVQEGLSPEGAKRRARLEFGGLESFKEDCRQARGLQLLDELRADLKQAFRQMRRSPGFTAVTLMMLAIGIGANTAMFGLLDAVLFKMLPVSNPEKLRQVEWRSLHSGFMRSYDGSNWRTPAGVLVGTSLSYPAYRYLRDRSTNMDLAGFGGSPNHLNLSIRGSAVLARGSMVTGNFFRVIGVNASLGRTITPEDDQRGGIASVAVLTYGFWQRTFGGDAGVLGQTIGVNGTPFVIIGVTPQGFQGLDAENPIDVMVPMTMQAVAESAPDRLASHRDWWLRILGRPKPGASDEAARAEIEVLLEQAILIDPPSEKFDPPTVALLPGGQGLEFLRNRLITPLLILTSAAALVLLIVCANIGGLLLTRAAARRKEIGTRLALGSGRPRLIRQMLTESLLLSLIGGALGIALSYALHDVLPLLLSRDENPVVLDMSSDTRTLLFSVLACIATGLVFGLAPALRATRVDLAPMLKHATGAASLTRFRSGRTLVIVQVSLSLILIIGAGCFVRTLANLRAEKLGFLPENLLLFHLDASLNGYEKAKVLDTYEEVLHEISALPGVRSVSLSRHPLLAGSRTSTTIHVPGYEPERGEDESTNVHYVAPKYFETMGIPILMGRDVDWPDREGAPLVCAVNEAFAKQFFQSGNPLGRTIGGGPRDPEEFEVIALVADAKYTDIRQPAPPTMYIPFRQHDQRAVTFVARTAGDPEAMTKAIRQTVASVDPNLPLFGVRTQIEQNNRATGEARLFANLLAGFGLLALFLACLGLYGTLAYSVAGRIPEIGLRMALGAQRGNVIRMILQESLVPVTLGLAIGLAAALLSMRFVSSLLYEVDPNDPVTLLAGLAILLVCATVAAWLPARRAARVDPMMALRYE